jgi:hypothetical protein
MASRPTFYRIRHAYWTTLIELITKCSITANDGESTGSLVLLNGLMACLSARMVLTALLTALIPWCRAYCCEM